MLSSDRGLSRSRRYVGNSQEKEKEKEKKSPSIRFRVDKK